MEAPGHSHYPFTAQPAKDQLTGMSFYGGNREIGYVTIGNFFFNFNFFDEIAEPLIGKNLDEFGPRFPDMSEPYKRTLIAKAKEIAARNNYDVKEGVYVSVTGPTFETRAEYQLIKIIGCDVVGMSTVQEAIVANHMGMDVFAMSVVTDLGIREDDNIITHEEVLHAAREAEPKLAFIFKELVASI